MSSQPQGVPEGGEAAEDVISDERMNELHQACISHDGSDQGPSSLLLAEVIGEVQRLRGRLVGPFSEAEPTWVELATLLDVAAFGADTTAVPLTGIRKLRQLIGELRSVSQPLPEAAPAAKSSVSMPISEDVHRKEEKLCTSAKASPLCECGHAKDEHRRREPYACACSVFETERYHGSCLCREYRPSVSGETAAPAKTQVRINAEKDPSYVPYCLRCDGLIRMLKVEDFYWRCAVCGAEHDERAAPATPTTDRSDQRIARMSGPELIVNAEEILERAGDKLSALCHGEKWRMSIPVSDHDSDIAFGRVIALARELLKSSSASPSVEEDSELTAELCVICQHLKALHNDMGCQSVSGNGAVCDCGFDQFGIHISDESRHPAGEGAPTDVAARITEYLSAGGLFNPEMMEHDKVRDLLIDCRAALGELASSLRSARDERDFARQMADAAEHARAISHAAGCALVEQRDAALSRVAELENQLRTAADMLEHEEAVNRGAFLKLREEVEALPRYAPDKVYGMAAIESRPFMVESHNGEHIERAALLSVLSAKEVARGR